MYKGSLFCCVEILLVLILVLWLYRNMSKSRYWRSRRSAIAQAHDSLLRDALKGEKYIKLYSFHYLINGFAVFVSSQQVYIILILLSQEKKKTLMQSYFSSSKRQRSFQGEVK